MDGNIAELEDNLPLSDGERVTLEYVANKLQMYDAEFHDHHYKLLDLIDDSLELVELQNILDGHELLNINLFMRITNIRCRDEKTVTPPPKPVDEIMYMGAYNCRLQLITSRTHH